jgi:hypothetical protein
VLDRFRDVSSHSLSFSSSSSKAVNVVLANGPFTPDLGGKASTADVVKAVIAQTQYMLHLDQMASGGA